MGRDAEDQFNKGTEVLFQSTRLREARPPPARACQIDLTFQSTRLREARRATGVTMVARRCFNPRACVRRDDTREPVGPIIDGFNPRACVRRDLGTPADPLRLDTFQSTRLREARPGQ